MDYNYGSLMKKAVITLTLMFGFLFAVVTGLLWYFDMPLSYALSAAVIVVLLQYLLSPLIIPILYKIEFMDGYYGLTDETWQFIEDTCKNINIRKPQIGIIKDGNPNAFTYGYFSGYAKLILTQGLIEKLSQEELEAVIAHELGHIKHNDFIVMMMVSLIPMIMYQVYTWTHRSDKSKPAYWVGIGAYAAYIFSQFFALSFSRIREYYADSFSKDILNNGEPLKNALIKIAYGYTSMEEKKGRKVATIGIANHIQNEGFVLTQYKNLTSNNLEEKLIGWDMKNIWGRWYELNSTHPLTAKRILALEGKSSGEYAVTASDVLKFLLEAAIGLLPWISGAIIYFTNRIRIIEDGFYSTIISVAKQEPLYMILLGAALLIKFYYSYGKDYQEYKLKELLSNEDASPVKGIPAVIEGKVIGRGIPGYFFSEDLVIDDGTAIMLIDYRQPHRIFEIIFSLARVEELKEKDVKVVGWYKRGHRPYFQCRHIYVDNKRLISFNYILTELFGYALIAAGIVMYLIF
ncbi:MAG TPA: zinc metalloprotease HtpX [Clostridia bacterium]|nr:zinc metalloprotease HtpX [Clostridia bacterium]